MQKNDNTPLWVFLAFSSIEKRQHALWLIWACVVFSVYCLPWGIWLQTSDSVKDYLIDDWSWIAMMLPICIWYWLSLRWMDANAAW